MKNFWISAACMVLAGVSVTPTAAQPILNRVEQLLREQINNAVEQGAANQGQPAEPGYLGMLGDDSAAAGRGVTVVEVYSGQAAANSGMRAGDLVTRIDGREVRSMDDMAAVLGEKGPGAKLTFTVQRDGTAKDLRVTLGKRSASDAPIAHELPPPEAPPRPIPPSPGYRSPTSTPPAQPPLAAPARPRLGVRTVPVTPEVQRQHQLPAASGAQVVSVAVDSPAAKAGVPLGAVITLFGDTPVHSPEELTAAVRASDKRDVQLTYVHAGRTQNVTVDFGTLILSPLGPPTPGPQLETRARPPQPSPPSPVDAVSPTPPTPTPATQSPTPPTLTPPSPAAQLPNPNPTPQPTGGETSRIEALERRIAELEARIKALEEKLPNE